MVHSRSTAFFVPLALTIGIFFYISVRPALAESCCTCRHPDDPKTNVCITTPQTDCVMLKTLGKTSDIKSLDCTPLKTQNCQSITKNGTCNQGPMLEEEYTKPASKTASETASTTILTPPTLNVGIPGLKFAATIIPQRGYITIPFLAQYVTAVYYLLLSIAAVAAAIMIIWGGFKYIVASTGASVKEGKGAIKDALIGLVLLLSAYTILQTVNPLTLNLQAIRVPVITTEQWHGDEDGGIPKNLEGTAFALGPGSSAMLPKSICSGAECKKYCDGQFPVQKLPKTDGIVTANELVDIPKHPGIYGSGKLRKEAVDALVNAANVAQKMPNGPYTLRIISTSRTLEDQLSMVCKALSENREKEIGINIANPGGSIHGSGVAVDLELWKNQDRLVGCCTVKTQTKETKEQNAKLLQDIMSSVGWVRYCAEVWHFEWGTNTLPNRSNACTWPPT